jgi:adenylate cyclase
MQQRGRSSAKPIWLPGSDRRRACALRTTSKRAELRRVEVEYAVSVPDAEALMALRHSGLIEKTRFTVPWEGSSWEVDVFSGDNIGLVIAEIELRHEHEPFERPPWLGREVTGRDQYYNGSLARWPYCQWASPLRVAVG